MNIAIDGPAGAGKSTIAKLVAKSLEYIYVDTGAMYRAMALNFLKQGLKETDTEAIVKSCGETDISIEYRDGEQRVILNGEDVSGLIRTEEVSRMASITSAIPEVRKKLVALQQKLAKTTSVVMDGRDIGTVVLPDARVKVYLTASAGARAIRRYKQLQETAHYPEGHTPDAEEEALAIRQIEDDIKERDYRDMNRAESPLKKADDAVLIDSSDLTIEEVVSGILGLVREAQNAEN